MLLSPRIILHSPLTNPAALGPFVEQCLTGGVCLLAIWGEGAEALEEEVDWLVIGDGADESRFLVTTAHTDECFADVLEFVADWNCEGTGWSEVRL